MRTLGRTHGISVAWLNEAYTRGEFELKWSPSAEMAADIFTKAFSNPSLWEAACFLVNICLPQAVQVLADRNGVPPTATEGGVKADCGISTRTGPAPGLAAIPHSIGSVIATRMVRNRVK